MPNPISPVELLYSKLDEYVHYKINTNDLLDSIGGLNILFNLLTATLSNNELIENNDTNYIIVKNCILRILNDNNDINLLKTDECIQYYLYGLSYNNDDIRSFTIDVIYGLSIHDNNWLIQQHSNLFDTLCNMTIKDNSLVVNKSLTKLYNNALQDKELVFNKLMNILPTNNNTLNQQSIVNVLRVYEIIVNVGLHDKQSYQLLSKYNIINKLLDLLQLFNHDTLTQLNIIESLTTYIIQSYEILHENIDYNNIINQLVLLIDITNNPTSQLLLGSIFSIIEQISLYQSKQHQLLNFNKTTIDQFNQIFITIFMEHNNNDTILSQNINCVSHICTTIDGLQWLTNAKVPVLKNQYNTDGVLLYHISQYATSTVDIVKLSAIHGIDLVIQTNYYDYNTTADQHKQTLFNLIGQYKQMNSMDIIISYIKLPFDDIRLKTYSLCESLSINKWGCNLLINTPGFVELLTNRSTELTINGLTARYAIVNTLVNNPVFNTINNPVAKKQLLEYKSQGAYIHERQAKVIDPLFRNA